MDGSNALGQHDIVQIKVLSERQDAPQRQCPQVIQPKEQDPGYGPDHGDVFQSRQDMQIPVDDPQLCQYLNIPARLALLEDFFETGFLSRPKESIYRRLI